MPQMERNVDIESIDSDSLFGIEALKHQSIGQKILFYGCLLLGILSNTLMPHFLHTPGIVNVAAFMTFLMIGIAGGCNYSQDISYGKYISLLIFEKKKVLTYQSPEDIRYAKRRKLKDMTEQKEKQSRGEQKRMIFKAVALILAIILMVAGIYCLKSYRLSTMVHHEVEGGMYE
ncbi:MAG: hypothetical protein K6E75_03200 [Lachnospiraceae bacterium]|nr:hypothetical protein [Lachnospiraceae bacterium]